MNLEDRLSALDARISSRLSALDARISSRFSPGGAADGDSGGGAAAPLGRDKAAGAPRLNVRRGLFIGLAEYDMVGHQGQAIGLGSCVRDAVTFADVAASLGEWKCHVLLNADATVYGIRKAIRDLALETEPGDTVLLFLSTHGGRASFWRRLFGFAPAGNDTLLLAYDGFYSEKDFRSDLYQFRQGVKLVVVVNACHSGGLFEKTNADPDNGGPGFAEEFVARLADGPDASGGDRASGLISPSDIGAIAAAAKNQTSIGNLSSAVCSLVPAALVQQGWLGGAADGFVNSIVSIHGESAIRSSAALCNVDSRANPGTTGFVSFLDLALYAVWIWRDVTHVEFATGVEAGRHVPQFYNPELLREIIAGVNPMVARGPASKAVPEKADRGEFGSGRRYGLYVGVNKYAVPCNELSGCVTDARNMAKVCGDLGGWRSSDQTILTDSRATVSAVRGALGAMASKARPGDVVLYFQSSHGGPNGGVFAAAANDTCLWCHDGRYEEEALREDLSRFRKGVKVIVVLDACYSGGLFEQGARAAEATGGVASMMDRILAKIGRGSAETVSSEEIGWITAAANRQTSLDHGQSGGYFTTFTLINNGWRAGMAEGVGGQKRAGCVTFLDLAVFAKNSWDIWLTVDGKPHVPSFKNPDVLDSVIAGRVGI